jgi:hypothetical protein
MRFKHFVLTDMAVFVVLGGLLLVAQSDYFGDADINQTWSRLDQPVIDGDVSRTWFWGPSAISHLHDEVYVDAPDGTRKVVYFDKNRMEINADAAPGSTWRVTNGLLATELVTGNKQTGKTTFVAHSPADINIAGDLDDPDGPTYLSFNKLLDAPALNEGTTITQTVDRAGNVRNDGPYAGYGVTAARYVPETGHTVASVFWEFMNSSGVVRVDDKLTHDKLFENPFYGTGYPITEAYWTYIRVDGVTQPVLVQVFQRRALTYTPQNQDGWKVEAGNVGLHYLTWKQSMDDTGNPPAPAKPSSGSGSDSGSGSSEECQQRSENVSSNGSVKQSNTTTVNQSGGSNNSVTCTQTNTNTQKR